MFRLHVFSVFSIPKKKLSAPVTRVRRLIASAAQLGAGSVPSDRFAVVPGSTHTHEYDMLVCAMGDEDCSRLRLCTSPSHQSALALMHAHPGPLNLDTYKEKPLCHTTLAASKESASLMMQQCQSSLTWRLLGKAWQRRQDNNDWEFLAGLLQPISIDLSTAWKDIQVYNKNRQTCNATVPLTRLLIASIMVPVQNGKHYMSGMNHKKEGALAAE
eukprot:1157186-Pelagomonas_calceolata.AAC.1